MTTINDPLPFTVPIDLDGLNAIPDELKEGTRFVGWRWTKKDGRYTKVPIDISNGALASAAWPNASVSDPTTWTTFEQAWSTLVQHQRDDPDGPEFQAMNRIDPLDGIGRVLTPKDNLVGIDIDKCRDPETAVIAPWALEIVTALDSYTEVTPSGTGIRIYVKGTLPPGGRSKPWQTGKVEVYGDGRYFTLTGCRIEGTPTTVEKRQDALTTLHETIFGKPQPAITTPSPAPREPSTRDDAEVLERARSCTKTGTTFTALFDRGDLTAPKEGDGSQNSADLSLCNFLRFWTGGDPHQMDRLFRQSALMRDKWDEKRGALTYGQKTITLALDGPTYTPGYSAPAPGESAQGDDGDHQHHDHGDLQAEVARLREIVAVQQARIAELEQSRAADITTAVQDYNRAIMQTIASAATPAKKVGMIALTAEAHSNRKDNYLSVEGLARRYHVGEDTLRTVRDSYAPDLFTVKTTYLTCSPYTGEVHDPPMPYSVAVPTKAAPAETLTAMVSTMPETFKAKPTESKPRAKRPDPEAPAETPACPVDGDRPTVTAMRAAAVTSCADCGMPLAAVTNDVVLTLPPEPTHPAQGSSPTPSVVTDISPDSVGSGDAAHRARHAWIQDRVALAAVRADTRGDAALGL